MSSRRAARGDEERVLGAVDELRARRRRGRAAAGTRPPRRAGRRAPCSPLPRTWTASCSKSTSREVEVDRLAAAQPGRVDELEQRAVAERERVDARRPARARRRPPRTSGASGSRRARLGPSWRVRDASRAEREPEQGAHRGQLARDRRRRELARIAARTRGAELGGVRAQRRGVDVLERLPALPKPGRELLDVDAVGATGRLGQLGRVEEALDEGAVRHLDGFALRGAIAC